MSRAFRITMIEVLVIGIIYWGEVALAQGVGSVPLLTGISPPGATIGRSTNCVISGRNLSKVKSLIVSGRGVDVVALSIQGDDHATVILKVAEDAAAGFREVRVDGPTGVSNLAILRVDPLSQVMEIEPNDSIATAQRVAGSTAIIGVLKSLDRDHFRIKGTPGQRLTIDLEARRLGTAISPVVTIFTTDGTALAQGRESAFTDRDCRMTVVLPDDGECVIQVRDNVYGGHDQARYRLRVDPSSYPSAVFPLGGPAGQTIDLEIAGGNLERSLHKPLKLPDVFGRAIDPGSVDGPSGPVAIPGRIMVGVGPEVIEATDRDPGSVFEVNSGSVVNGRISRPGEVDTYRFSVTAGQKLRLRVEAAQLGSWLDSVLTLRSQAGATLAENDDHDNALRPDPGRSVGPFGIPQGSSDSAIDYEARETGILTLAISDRFGQGGPEYAYRLAIGAALPDFAMTLLPKNVGATASTPLNLDKGRDVTFPAMPFGVFNLSPGDSVPVHFLVAIDGRPGPIEVSADGLPEGVTAEPVQIRFPGPGSSKTARSEPVADYLILKVARSAKPSLGELQIIGRARPTPTLVMTRHALATIRIDNGPLNGQPITRTIDRIPIKVLGEP